MKKIVVTFFVIITSFKGFAQNVGIGTASPNASAQLDVTSSNSGFLPPRMTYAQRNAIVNPAAGLIVYCTDCANGGEMQYFNGTGWIRMSVGAASAPFTTPTISTNTITIISSSGAVSGGNISSNGGSNITARGTCWSTAANPTIALTTKTNDGTGTGTFTSTITGLTPSSTYYVRAYATNSAGTAYGTQQIFTTLSAAVLPSVVIGSQVWSSKNLDVATFRNGDSIPQVADSTQWASLTTGAWCWYNNDSANGAIYGRLYNWYAVNDPMGLAPQGWHLASDGEWNKLNKFLDNSVDTTCQCWSGSTIAGKLKNPNWGNGNNSSGFNGLPGGLRNIDGIINNGNSLGSYSYWWCTNGFDTNGAWMRVLVFDGSGIFRIVDNKKLGLSVRVLKD